MELDNRPIELLPTGIQGLARRVMNAIAPPFRGPCSLIIIAEVRKSRSATVGHSSAPLSSMELVPGCQERKKNIPTFQCLLATFSPSLCLPTPSLSLYVVGCSLKSTKRILRHKRETRDGVVTEDLKGREVTSKVGNKSCRRSRCKKARKTKKKKGMVCNGDKSYMTQPCFFIPFGPS